MPIDINGLSNNQMQVNGDRNSLPVNEREPVGRSPETGRSSVQDTVSFSETAVRMGQMGAAMDDTPVVDVQRVAKARQAILDGTYNIDPTRVAEKLMEFDNLLGGSGRPE